MELLRFMARPYGRAWLPPIGISGAAIRESSWSWLEANTGKVADEGAEIAPVRRLRGDAARHQRQSRLAHHRRHRRGARRRHHRHGLARTYGDRPRAHGQRRLERGTPRRAARPRGSRLALCSEFVSQGWRPLARSSQLTPCLWAAALRIAFRWSSRKRPTTAFVGRNDRQTDAKSGKAWTGARRQGSCEFLQIR